jgi:hypothetical protein
VFVCEELERHKRPDVYTCCFITLVHPIFTLSIVCVQFFPAATLLFCFLFWTDAKCHSRERSLEGVAIDQPSFSRHLRCVFLPLQHHRLLVHFLVISVVIVWNRTRRIAIALFEQTWSYRDSNDPKGPLSIWTPYLRDWTPHSRWKYTTMLRVLEATRGYTTSMCSTT